MMLLLQVMDELDVYYCCAPPMVDVIVTSGWRRLVVGCNV